jgi:thiosulfate/3-mercaptopyruvate sulfurtransferase
MNDSAILTKGYAHPEALVSTEWLAQHLGDPSVRLLESNEDVLLYDVEHIPGAQKIDWHADLNDPVVRDYISRDGFERLCRAKGIDARTTVVFYGDKNNWWATYAFWVFRLFGLQNLRILDGGRTKWIAEGRPTTTEIPVVTPSTFTAADRVDAGLRAYIDEVRAHQAARRPLIDVRSAPEYTGERTHMPEYPQEGTLRGGHIPGARSVPWARSANSDGTFKSRAELAAIYEGEAQLTPTADVITYCRIGERSSHTWFVLTYLLGYANVRNYDGSWTEWGNAVRTPIVTGTEP